MAQTIGPPMISEPTKKWGVPNVQPGHARNKKDAFIADSQLNDKNNREVCRWLEGKLKNVGAFVLDAAVRLRGLRRLL